VAIAVAQAGAEVVRLRIGTALERFEKGRGDFATAADADFAAAFRPRVVSSSLALTWVAGGRRAAYVTDGDVAGSVHFSAGLAICAAAGCAITDLRGDCGGAGGAIVAADEATHAALLDLVARQLA